MAPLTRLLLTQNKASKAVQWRQYSRGYKVSPYNPPHAEISHLLPSYGMKAEGGSALVGLIIGTTSNNVSNGQIGYVVEWS